MKRKNSARRLVLNKETISVLNPLEMHGAQGGTEYPCPPTYGLEKCILLTDYLKPSTRTCPD
jgi:hypothetical protein